MKKAISALKNILNPTKARVERWQKSLAEADAKLHAAQNRLGAARFADDENSNDETRRELEAARKAVEAAYRDRTECEYSLRRANELFEADLERAKITKETLAWEKLETELEPKVVELAAAVDKSLDAAVRDFLKILDLLHDAAGIVPKTDCLFNDSPAADHWIETYFRRHLRKRGCTWSYPHPFQETESLETFSESVTGGWKWVRKFDAKRAGRTNDPLP